MAHETTFGRGGSAAPKEPPLDPPLRLRGATADHSHHHDTFHWLKGAAADSYHHHHTFLPAQRSYTNKLTPGSTVDHAWRAFPHLVARDILITVADPITVVARKYAHLRKNSHPLLSP